MTIVRVVGAAILADGRCLVARRGPTMSFAGRWEFPGGKVEPGEGPQEALARELREELGIEVVVGAWVGRGECEAERRRIVLDVYVARVVGDGPTPTEHDRVRWVDAAGLAALTWAAADVPVVDRVATLLRAARSSRLS